MRISSVETAGEPAWQIENDQLRLRLSKAHLGLSITDKRCGKTWEMEPETDGFGILKYGTLQRRSLGQLCLDDAREVRESSYRGVELMSVVTNVWANFNMRIRVMLHETDPELCIVVAPHEDPGYNAEGWIREVYYPRSFVHGNTGKEVTILPVQQGMLLPGDWHQSIEGEDAIGLLFPWSWHASTGPWWGHRDVNGACYLAIMDTPDDARYDFSHPPGGPTRIAPFWLPSFEAFRYARRMLYRFFDAADHVDVALAYRAYCKRTGRWRSIEEKRLEKPQIDKFRGAIGVPRIENGTFRCGAWVHALVRSLKTEGVTERFRSFDEIAEILKQAVSEHPDENMYMTLAGWQTLGYDHAHPAACPPSQRAGGWDGMRNISRIAAEAGILLGVHEQYRDFFYSSPFWDESRTRKDSRRDSPRHKYWAGGTQSILCPTFMLDYVKMNVQQLRDNHIELNASTQDVLTAIPLEECFDPNHPCTRTQCREARAAVFEYYRELGWAINSESPSDWAAPLLDSFLVASGPVFGDSDGRGRHGIPVPLLSLVFHDSLFMLALGVPRIGCALSGINNMQLKDKVLRRLHAETAYMPLTAHTLLSDDGMQQESVFGDSVYVRTDFESGDYSITGLSNGDVAGNAAEAM